jgi:hypothetical protein
MLKSLFFQNLDLKSKEGEEFCRALATFLKLPAQVLQRLAKELPRMNSFRLRSQKRAFVRKQVTSLGISFVDGQHAVDAIMAPFLSLFTDKETADEKPASLVEDMVNLKLLTALEGKKVLPILEVLKNEGAPELKKLRRLREFSQGVLPSFRSIGTTVELRSIVPDPYKLGDEVSKYQPKSEGLIPIASITLSATPGADERECTRICFQCDEEELQWVIDKLEATKMDLSLAKRLFAPVDSERPAPRASKQSQRKH